MATVEQLRAAVDRDHATLSIARQCELLGLPRSSFYYQPTSLQDPLDLLAMNRIDTLYTKAPFYGSRRMTEALQRGGLEVNRKRIQRLMHQMGLRAIYRSPQDQCLQPRAQEISIFASRPEYRATEPRLEYGYHLFADEERLSLSRSDHRLV